MDAVISRRFSMVEHIYNLMVTRLRIKSDSILIGVPQITMDNQTVQDGGDNIAILER